MSGWTDSRPARTPGMSAKEEILARVRAALAVPRRDEITEAADVPRTYQRADDKQELRTAPKKARNVLVQRLEDSSATVRRATVDTAPAVIAAALGGARSVVVPSGLPAAWHEQVDASLVVDDGTTAPHQLEAIDAVLTGCHTAIALTGTIVLRNDARGGRRAISLLPDHHVVVVEPEQVVVGVPRAIERMAEAPAAAWTMISGPSATSGIDLERVEGVHGPRRLEVILIEPEPEPEPDPATSAVPGTTPRAAAADPQEKSP
ncbi:lactate utilization protein C [Brachybacterium vulturis]|uniref:LutC/YkgG family protein n=1 Tax=Brachybacterium vulturis TaxID=2017484 RepID=UPI0037358891